MKDFYGNELTVGDRVLYGGGYAVVREGIIEKITDTYISIRPYRDAYGEKTRTKYYHEVTGKWIDPWYHQAQEAGNYHKETGEKVPWSNRNKFKNVPNSGWGYKQEPNPDYVPEELVEWRDCVYKDYVKEVKLKGGYVSVIYNPGGIVKLPVT
jgi:hypothetical protein